MKKLLIPIIIIIIILVGGFVILEMKSPTSAPVTPPPLSNSGVPTDNIYLSKTDSTKGTYITDFAGMTLYTYGQDINGASNCSGDCLAAWPVYTSGAVSQGMFPENISVITRSDGSKQFAWRGMPLYYFTGDKNPGDITGDGVDSFEIVKL